MFAAYDSLQRKYTLQGVGVNKVICFEVKRGFKNNG